MVMMNFEWIQMRKMVFGIAGMMRFGGLKVD